MKRLLIFTLILCLVFLCGCEKDDGDDIVVSDTSVVYGGTLRLSMGTSDTLNPLLAKDETVRDALFAVYEPLIAVTAQLEPKGILAESWSFNSDCTSLTVKLKSNVLWHDSTTLAARDVVYSVDTIKSDPEGPYYDMLRYVSSAVETDPLTVRFDLTRSYSQLLYSLYFPIIPLGAGDLTSAAVGTGAFALESYSPGQSLSLMRFDDYRNGAAGFDKISFSIVRENITASSAFSSGVTDAAQSGILDFDDFAVRDKYNVKRSCGADFEYIGLNHRCPVFSSPTVRCALSNAIDRSEIIEGSYGDENATAANIPMHPLALRWSPSASSTDYNSAGAVESLFYDGWTDKYGDGVLAKDIVSYSMTDEDGSLSERTAENVRLEFSLLVNKENSRRTAAANTVASLLAKSGFDVTVVELDFEDYLSRIESGDFEAYLGGTSIGNLYDLEFLLAPDGNQNYFGYSSEYMQTALEAVASNGGEDAFANACAVLQEVFVREQPVVGLAFLDDSLLLSKNIAGGTSPLFGSPFGNVGKWFFLK